MPAYAIGDRVKVRDDRLPGFITSFAKYIKGRPATVISLPKDGEFSGFRGKVKVEFDVKRKGAEGKREWLYERELELIEAVPGRLQD